MEAGFIEGSYELAKYAPLLFDVYLRYPSITTRGIYKRNIGNYFGGYIILQPQAAGEAK